MYSLKKAHIVKVSGNAQLYYRINLTNYEENETDSQQDLRKSYVLTQNNNNNLGRFCIMLRTICITIPNRTFSVHK